MRVFRYVLFPTAAATAVVTSSVRPLAAQKRDRDVITREEIQASAMKTRDLYTAIRSLRPHFLAGDRRPPSMTRAVTAPVLYIDGNRGGDLDGLRSMMANDVEEIRYLSPSAAVMQFGQGHDGGAILVKLFKRGPSKPPSS
jgi:hypothetical protein